MKGRVYDYNLGRFMSVDPLIQSPGNSQSLNPYSYIMNNPLAGTDPTGYCAVSRLSRVCDNTPAAFGGNGKSDLKMAAFAKYHIHKDSNGTYSAQFTMKIKLTFTAGKLTGIGSLNSISKQSSEGGGNSAPKTRPMPKLLEDFMQNRVSFPQGIGSDIARTTIGEIEAQAVNYFGLNVANLPFSSAEWVARTAIGEFNQYSQEYVEAMAWVARNRVESKKFPNTYKSVVLQRKQFSSWNKGNPNRGKILNYDMSDPWAKSSLKTIRIVINSSES